MASRLPRIPPPLGNGPLTPLEGVPGVFWIEGVFPVPVNMRATRTMTIVQSDDGTVTVVNPVRLVPHSEKDLLKLGSLKRAIFLGNMHGMDARHYGALGAEIWALPGNKNLHVDTWHDLANAPCPVPETRVISLPGLRVPEVALFLERRRLLLTCDIIQNYPTVRPREFPPPPAETGTVGPWLGHLLGFKGEMITPPMFVRSASPDGRLSGLEPLFYVLEELGYEVAITGHGPPHRDAKTARARWLKSHHLLTSAPAGSS